MDTTDNTATDTGATTMKKYVVTPNMGTTLSSTWREVDAPPRRLDYPREIYIPFLATIRFPDGLVRAYTERNAWNQATAAVSRRPDADQYTISALGRLPEGWHSSIRWRMDPEPQEEPEEEDVLDRLEAATEALDVKNITGPGFPVEPVTRGSTIDEAALKRRTTGGDWGRGYNVHPDDEEMVRDHLNGLKSMGLTPPPTFVPLGTTLITAGLDAWHAKRRAVDSMPKLLDSRNHLVQLIHEEKREDYRVNLSETEMVADGRALVLTGKGIPDLRLEPSAFNGLSRIARFPNLGFLKTQDARAISELWRSQLRQRNFDGKEMMLRTRLDAEGVRAMWALNNATYGVFDSDAVLDALVEAYGGDIRAAVTYDGQGTEWEIRQYGKVPPVVGEVYGHFMKGSTSDGGKLAGINFNGGFEQAVCWNLTTYDHVLDLVKTRHRGSHTDIYNRLVYRLREKDTRHLFDRFRVDVETAHKVDAVEALNKGVARRDKHSLISRRLALGASGTAVLKALLQKDKALGAWSRVGADLEACAENEGVDLAGQITLFELNRTLNRMHSRERVPTTRVAAFEKKAGRVLSLASL